MISLLFMLSFEANVSTSILGSAPGDNTNIKGLKQVESWYADYRSKGGNSMKSLSMYSSIMFCTAGMNLSGRSNLTNKSF